MSFFLQLKRSNFHFISLGSLCYSVLKSWVELKTNSRIFIHLPDWIKHRNTVCCFRRFKRVDPWKPNVCRHQQAAATWRRRGSEEEGRKEGYYGNKLILNETWKIFYEELLLLLSPTHTYRHTHTHIYTHVRSPRSVLCNRLSVMLTDGPVAFRKRESLERSQILKLAS